MSILRKPLDSVTIADLEALVASQARETDELEFKGKPYRPDRWIETGDRVGDYARDEILGEIVAFANAGGGTLILGMHETKETPRRAERLEKLPNCESLALRLLDACEDVIEPRLASINGRALPDESGAGYVLMRVAKSPIGPHRLSATREFLVRRGERASKMSVREIKDLTLELARSADRIEELFRTQQIETEKFYKSLKRNTAPARPNKKKWRRSLSEPPEYRRCQEPFPT